MSSGRSKCRRINATNGLAESHARSAIRRQVLWQRAKVWRTRMNGVFRTYQQERPLGKRQVISRCIMRRHALAPAVALALRLSRQVVDVGLHLLPEFALEKTVICGAARRRRSESRDSLSLRVSELAAVGWD